MRISAPCLLFAAALPLCGCKSAPRAPAPVPVSTTPKPTRFDAMTDEQLVRANQSDGLGIGLKAGGMRFAVGAPVPLHLVVEDIAARQPIASGLCRGLSLVATDLNTQDSQTNEIVNTRCIGTVPYPDEIPFEKGRIKATELTQRTASMVLAPGTYSLTVVWHALPAGKGTIQEQPAYGVVTSNAVEIVVGPQG